MGTDENLFRLLPLELVPVPWHGSQICARAPTEGYVQTGAHAQAQSPGTKSEQGLSNIKVISCRPHATNVTGYNL